MSNCYKCGRELAFGQTECEPGECLSNDPTFMTDEKIEEAGREWAKGVLEVDWSKVTTLAQVIELLQAADVPIYVPKDSPAAKKLKGILRPFKY